MDTDDVPAACSGAGSTLPEVAAPANFYMTWTREAIIAERKEAQNTLDAIRARIQPIVDDIAIMDSALAHIAIAEMQALGQKGDHLFLQDPEGDFVIEIDNRPKAGTPDRTVLEQILEIKSLEDDPQRKKAIWRESVPEEIIPAHTEVRIQGNSLAKLARENPDVAAIVARSMPPPIPREHPFVNWVRKPKQVTTGE